MSNSTSLNVLYFAADTTIFYSDSDNTNLTLTLKRRIQNICNWLCANKLCLNIKKHNMVPLVLKISN